MRSERRIAAGVLLMVAAIPLLLALLPERGAVATVPSATIGIAVVVLTLPMPVRIRSTVDCLAWSTAAAIMVVYHGHYVPSTGPGWLLFVPFGLALLTERDTVVGLGLAAAVGLHLFGPDRMPAAPERKLLDALGPATALSWLCWQGWRSILGRGFQRAAQQGRSTATALDEAIVRDSRRLERIARVVADPSLRGPIRGLGLGTDSLGLAARIDSHRVLLGWIDGPPLATLTVGWALLAAARAGAEAPRELLRLAREHLDEVVPPTAIRWLAVWDRRSTYLDAAPIPGGSFPICVLSSRGPNASPTDPVDSKLAIAELSTVPEDIDAPGPLPGAPWWIAPPLLTTMGAALACLFVDPVPLALSAVMLCSANAIGGRAWRRARAVLAVGQQWLAERIEIYDDMRFEIAKLHGSMLPYRIEVGDVAATAHRLRSEVLDGCFADMLVDQEGSGHIVAGEIAGRGLAARFLGLAAQITVRVHLTRSGPAPTLTSRELRRDLLGFGEALEFPVRVRSGSVTLHRDGRCVGSGLIRRLVEVRSREAVDAPATTRQLLTVTCDARISNGNRLYITPAAAHPGPEDDAPALRRREATDRIVELIADGRWQPGDGSLASLFSLVFDGRTAPAHGTLIEIAAARDVENEDELSRAS